MAPKPGAVAIGPGLPEAREPHHDEPGFSFESRSQPRPHFSIAPGRKFSTTMSAPAASLRTISCASGCLRSSVTDFLLRACAYHHSDVPWCSLRHFLSGSPAPGGSILITSAPNSASRRAQNGPGDQRAQLDHLDALQRKGLRFAHVTEPLATENAESAGNSIDYGLPAPVVGPGRQKNSRTLSQMLKSGTCSVSFRRQFGPAAGAVVIDNPLIHINKSRSGTRHAK